MLLSEQGGLMATRCNLIALPTSTLANPLRILTEKVQFNLLHLTYVTCHWPVLP